VDFLSFHLVQKSRGRSFAMALWLAIVLLAFTIFPRTLALVPHLVADLDGAYMVGLGIKDGYCLVFLQIILTYPLY